MSNENENGDGKGEKDFFVITYGRQYLDSTLRQENDYYVNDWENFKKVANEKGDYVEFEEAYVEEGNVKYKKIKRQCPMSEYEKEINDLNKSIVNENASVSPEDNVVLTLKNEEKDEEDQDKDEEEIEVNFKNVIKENNEEEKEEEIGNDQNKDEIIEKNEKDNDYNQVLKTEIIKDNSSEIEKSSEEDQDKDEEEIEVNLKDVTLSSVESGIHQKEIDALNKTNALNKSDINEDEDVERLDKSFNKPVTSALENLGEYNKDVNSENNKISKKTEIINLISKKENGNKDSKDNITSNSQIQGCKIAKDEINVIIKEDNGEEKKETTEDKNALNQSNVSKDKDHEENESGGRKQNDQHDRKKDVNSEDKEKEQKTEIVKLVSETENNINKNQKKGIPAPNSTLNIALLVDKSESFADFLEKLTRSDKNIDLSRLDFGGVSLCFLNCCRAFFLTLFDGLGLNGFWNRLCLRVFFENARSKGKSYCFEVPKIPNDQSQDPNTLNKPQYEQNIYWLSSAINKAKQQVVEEAGIDVNNRNPDKQQLH